MFSPLGMLASAASGVFVGIIGIISSVSLAALIFAGDLEGYLVHGINIALVTALVSGLITAIFGSYKASIAIPQDRTAPILAIMAASVAAMISTRFPAEQAFFSVVVLIVATTVLTGLFLLFLGWARVGDLVRFMPYSVLGGFLAGTGWLLVLGGLRVMTGLELDSVQDVIPLLQPEVFFRWGPGLLAALAVIALSRFFSPLLALPVVLCLSALSFFLAMSHSGYTLEQLGQADWLIGPLQSATQERPGSIFWEVARRADWSVISDQWLNIWSVLFISAISVIFSVSALEMSAGKDIDINRELRVAGVANLVSGVGGGMPGFHSLSLSTLAQHFDDRTRVPGVVAALAAGMALLFGAEAIGYIPRFVIGAILVYLGLSFLKQWLLDNRATLTPGEFLVVLLILVVIVSVGFVEGIFTGLLAALFLFVWNYSRVPVVLYQLTGADSRSTVERNPADENYLVEHGGLIRIIKLRGYLFFGTMVQLINFLRDISAPDNGHSIRFVILDFAQVSGIDSSASYHFNRLLRIARCAGFRLVLTNLSAAARKQLFSGDLLRPGDQVIELPDMDHGLEWCEDQLLVHNGGGARRSITTILQSLAHTMSEQSAAVFRSYLQQVDFDAGQLLVEQGAPSDCMYFLEAGEVSVFLRDQTGEQTRVRRTGAGTVIGELGYYLDTPRSASVVADTPGTAYRLDEAALERMKAEHPELAEALHRFLAILLAERLHKTTQTLGILMK